MPLRLTLAGLLLALLAACAQTPDLSAWSESSSKLADSYVAESEAVEKGWTDTVAWASRSRARLVADEGRALEGKLVELRENNAEIEAALRFMVIYSRQLASLAAAGETGSAAAKSISRAIVGLGAVVGIVPGGSLATTAVGEALVAIADIVTRAQSQESLARIMSDLQPEIDSLAQALGTAAEGQIEIVKVWGDKTPVMLAAEPVQGAAERYARRHQGDFESLPPAEQALFLQMRDIYEARLDRQREIAQTVRERVARLKAIPAAAEAWSDAHEAAATLLVECGGFQLPSDGCGADRLASLSVFAALIDKIRGGGSASPSASPQE